MEEPASFFYDGDRPLHAEDFDDPFRRGILTIARATSEAELAWLRETVASLDAGSRGSAQRHGRSLFCRRDFNSTLNNSR